MNRARIARENAGLSVGQATALLGWSHRDLLEAIESGEHPPSATGLRKLADLYHVDVAWLRGDGPQRDYATIDAIDGSGHLTDHDRDVLAEFAASLPRRTT